MADIKQAAIWMDEGKAVRRPHMLVSIAQKLPGFDRYQWIKVLENGALARDGRSAIFTTEEFLADDWEIAP